MILTQRVGLLWIAIGLFGAHEYTIEILKFISLGMFVIGALIFISAGRIKLKEVK